MKSNIFITVYIFFIQFKNISYYRIKKELSLLPNYPSLASISQLLHRYNINHVVVETDIIELQKFCGPFIAHLKQEQVIFISKITDKYIYTFSPYIGSKKITIEKFQELWSNIVFIPLNTPSNNKLHKILCLFLLLIQKNIGTIICTLLFILYYNIYSNIFLFLFCFFNILGIYITYQLIRQEQQNNEPGENPFCKIGIHFDCQKVISSKYSKIGHLFSWAQLGFAYFGSLFIVGLFAPFFFNPYTLLVYLILSIPFCILSIIIQVFFLKKFCLFCCSTVLIIWIQTTLISLLPRPVFSWQYMTYLTIVYIVCLITTFIYEKYTSLIKKTYTYQKNNNKFKYDITLNLLLKHFIPLSIDDNTGILLHKGNSNDRVTFFLSISCPHCAESLNYLKKAIEIFPEFTYHIIFTNRDTEAQKIISYLLNVNLHKKGEEYFRFLNAYYQHSEKNISYLRTLYPLNNLQDQTSAISKMQKIWEDTHFQYVPAIMVNNSLLPLEYAPKDILNILYSINTL